LRGEGLIREGLVGVIIEEAYFRKVLFERGELNPNEAYLRGGLI
jgi:hypothetical protein